jgi:hypothetical protein
MSTPSKWNARPAREARRDADLGQAAGALGLDKREVRTLLARFGRWSPYR